MGNLTSTKLTHSTLPENVVSNVNISHLPRELLHLIFCHLVPSFRDLANVMLVCRRWYQVGGDPVLWRTFTLVVNKPRNLLLCDVISLPRLRCLKYLQISGFSCDPAVINDDQVGALAHSGLRLHVSLHRCCLSSVSPAELGVLVKVLEGLVMRQTNCTQLQTNTILQAASQSRKLMELDISYNNQLRLDHLDPWMVAQSLTSVRKISLGSIHLTQTQLRELFRHIARKTSRLRYLDLGHRSLEELKEEVMKVMKEAGARGRLRMANICPEKFITTPYIQTYTV